LESNHDGRPIHTAADRFRIGYSDASINVSIEVDKHTADVLQMRAAELGVTVPQLIAELATLDSAPREADADEIAELDRRYARATEGSRVPHERVVQWLRTWGTPRFRQWPGQ
jgi:predicted transcriptional regulator